jgi:hypothetical protein
MSNMPFRIVAFSDGAPYPLDESQNTAEPSHMVNLWSGERFHRVESIRQPVAEDYLRPHRPLPPIPIEEHDSDQDLPIIEPESYWNDLHADDYPLSQPEHADEVNLGGRGTISATRCLNIVKAGPVHKSAINLPTRASHEFHIGTLPEFGDPDAQDAPVTVAAIGDDMFSPVLGGLHRIPSAPARKSSKMDRLKRFFSFKGRRQSGRATR